MTRALPFLFLAAAACSSPANQKVLAKIGAGCAADADCGSGHCIAGVCSKECAGQLDCPRGFDCGLAHPGDAAATCYAATWPAPAEGGFGTGCAEVAGGCTGNPTPCAEGFECIATVKCDAEAYCSRACTDDHDCPPALFCGYTGPTNEQGTRRVCTRRGSCAPCAVDDQCGEQASCNPGPDGDWYCGHTCNGQNDCLRPYKDPDSTGQTPQYPPFEVCAPDTYGREQKICQPAAGHCSGKSVLAAVTATGGVCAPCRLGMPDDCAAGLRCLMIPAGERFCTRACTVGLVRTSDGYGIADGSDSCPTGTFCFFGGRDPGNCGAACSVDGICTGDPTYRAPTCYPPGG